MRFTRHTVCLFGALFLLSSTSSAQRASLFRDGIGTWQLNVGLGTTHYAGDLSVMGNYRRMAMGATIDVAVAHRLSTRLSLRAEAQLYYLRGNHRNTRNYYKNLSFYSINPDLWAGVQVDLWPIDDPNRSRIPYGFVGLGVTYMTPRAIYQGHSYSLAPLHTEGVAYNRLAPLLRYGVGLPIWTGARMRVMAEAAYTHVGSDYLDDVSTTYPAETPANPLAAALSDRRTEIGLSPQRNSNNRGNPGRKDGYMTLTGRLVYVLDTPLLRTNRRWRRG